MSKSEYNYLRAFASALRQLPPELLPDALALLKQRIAREDVSVGVTIEGRAEDAA